MSEEDLFNKLRAQVFNPLNYRSRVDLIKALLQEEFIYECQTSTGAKVYKIAKPFYVSYNQSIRESFNVGDFISENMMKL